MPTNLEALARTLSGHVNRDRLLATAIDLISVPSPTGSAGAAASRLAAILEDDGFSVERFEAGHPVAPAVVARLDGARPGGGRTLELNGHLDTVHLPFVPARVEGGLLRGSGAADMKGGLAAAVEALRVLRAAGLPGAGSVLLVAEDLHEAPWGHGEQLEALIRGGIVGDAVLLPEPLSTHLPLVGRGAAVWKARVWREGAPVHEVQRPPEAPSVLLAAADLATRIEKLNDACSVQRHPDAGPTSVFVGQLHAGEIYNGFASEALLEGTTRWIPGASSSGLESELRLLCSQTAARRGLQIDLDYKCIRGSFELDAASPIVLAFDRAFALLGRAPLPRGPKLFVDDGNLFSSLAGVPTITFGPRAGGQHTLEEWVDIEDLVRLATVQALTAALFCTGEVGSREQG